MFYGGKEWHLTNPYHTSVLILRDFPCSRKKRHQMSSLDHFLTCKFVFAEPCCCWACRNALTTRIWGGGGLRKQKRDKREKVERECVGRVVLKIQNIPSEADLQILRKQICFGTLWCAFQNIAIQIRWSTDNGMIRNMLKEKTVSSGDINGF